MTHLLSMIFLMLIMMPIYSQPPKLPNCGNTCFLNAATQTLLSISSLSHFLKKNDLLYREGLFGSVYQKLVKNIQPLQSAPQQFLTPYVRKSSQIITNLTGQNPYAQEDAAEFLGEVIHMLRTEGNPEMELFISNLVGVFKTVTIECPTDNNQYYIASPEKTAIDYYLTLPVIAIGGQPLNTLDKCLREFTKDEILDDPANYYALEGIPIPNCKKINRLLHASPIFIINLNRYAFDQETGRAKKITHKVTMPLQFDSKPYFSSTTKDTNYRLIAAILHQGTASGGHYVAYVNHKDQWYLCDDSVITAKSRQEVEENTKEGYVYVYEQITDSAIIPSTERRESFSSLRNNDPLLPNKLNQLKMRLKKLQQSLAI